MQGSDLPFSHKGKVTVTHEQSIICHKIHLDGITHEQAIICRQLLQVTWWALANEKGENSASNENKKLTCQFVPEWRVLKIL